MDEVQFVSVVSIMVRESTMLLSVLGNESAMLLCQERHGRALDMLLEIHFHSLIEFVEFMPLLSG